MSSSRPTTRAGAKRAQSQRSKAATKRTKGGRGRRWAKRLGLTALLGMILAAIAFFAAYATIDKPQPNDLVNAQTSIIYYADGKSEMGRLSVDGGNRESVQLKQIPDAVQKAHLAAEDRDFYTNSGISPSGILRGAWETLRGGGTQSGSTITQQYVKNYFLTSDQTLSRKAREIIISIKIGKEESKDEILQNYLNTIYYGRGAYGIQTASRAYFGKDVSKLTPSEGALLASVVKGPSLFDPGLGAQQKANAEARWQYVMDGMVKEGWITPDQRAKAAFPTKTLKKYVPNSGVGGPQGFLVQQVKQELRNKLKLTDEDIDKGGLRIVTTIDKKAEEAAINAVEDRMPKDKKAATMRAGLVSIRPGDGAIVAMYGGKDYRKEQLNTAVDATMQAGSTFKPFALLAGLMQDKPISTKTRFNGTSPQYFTEFEDSANPRGKVTNFGGQPFGYIDLRTATANSVNTVYAKLNIEVGADNTKKAAIAAGLPDDAQAKARKLRPLGTNVANVLGTDSVTVKDMATAYSTLASGGTRVTPYMVKSVKGGPGGLDYKAKVTKKQGFDKDVVADAVDAMQQVVIRGSGSYAQQLGRPVAGKTGTTSDNKAAWFNGFTPQLETAVGLYSSGKNGEELSMTDVGGYQEITGATIPVRIWTDYMETAMKGMPVEQFPERAGLGDDEVYTPPPPTSSSTPPPATSSSSTSSSSTTTTKPPTTTSTPPPTTSTPPPTTKTNGTGKPTPPTITLLGDRPRSTSTP
jgi:membrane peptidoglycan carboxypeptidase